MPRSAPPAPQYATWHTIDHRLRVYFDQNVTLTGTPDPARLQWYGDGYKWPGYAIAAYANYVSVLCTTGQMSFRNNVCDYETPPLQIVNTDLLPAAPFASFPVTRIP